MEVRTIATVLGCLLLAHTGYAQDECAVNLCPNGLRCLDRDVTVTGQLPYVCECTQPFSQGVTCEEPADTQAVFTCYGSQCQSGSFNSINYPNLYNNRYRALYLLFVPGASSFTFSFNANFHIEEFKDELYVGSGLAYSDNQLDGLGSPPDWFFFEGEIQPNAFTVQGDVVWMYFGTDKNIQEQGFEIYWNAAVDSDPPVFPNCPSNIVQTVELGVTSAVVQWTIPTATDASSFTTSSTHNPGTSFATGLTTDVLYTATDEFGNIGSCGFTVTVVPVDTTPPTILSCPSNIVRTVEVGTPGTTVSWAAPTATDLSGIASSVPNIDSGSFFNVGQTLPVSYTITDGAGNINPGCVFTVTVTGVDNTPPVVTSGSTVREVELGTPGLNVFYTEPTATDNSGNVVLFSRSAQPGDFFTVGTTVIDYVFVDASGLTASGTFTVIVNTVDTTNPVVTSGSTVREVELGTPGLNVFYTEPTATDNSGNPVLLSRTGQPGDFFTIGTTVIDYVFVDPSGNEGRGTFTVIVNTGLFFPFGVSEGDEFLPANDDGSTSELPISTVFPFFDHDHKSLFVNNNGVISFLVSVSQFTPDAFPLGDGRRLITPFWGDVDTRNGGTVSYREVLRFSSNDEIFLAADQIIQGNFVEMMRFQSSWMYVATWDSVAFYETRDATITNTFQAVLLTDGRYSFVIFNYGDINWTTGTASGGDASTGLGGTPAQVGFNAGDGITYYSVPGSRTDAVVDIERTTNIRVPGRWVFRTDNTNIQGLQCTSTGDISLFPLVGTMLGGTQVFISGPCFNDTSFLVCDFGDGVFVSGELLSNTTALCVTPTFYKVGRVPLRVSLDGGETFDFQGVFTILNVEEVPVRVTSPATTSNQSVTELEVAWDTDVIQFVDVVDIVVRGYRETESQVELIGPIFYLATEVDYHLGYYRVVKIPSSFTDITDVGVIAVVESDTDVEGAVKATLWSEVHVLQWLRGYDTLEWCDGWISEETQADSSFLDVTPQCPCTFAQAQIDIGRFNAHPQCDVDSTSSTNCAHKPGAIHCVRANTPSELGGGQECCYGSDGFILNVLLSPGGGFSHRYHHAGVAPYGTPTKVPYMSHFLADILPWTFCCRYRLLNSELDQSESSCQFFSGERPSQVCDGYVPPPPALGSGDPHIATLDTTVYTFNGYGEFTLLNTLDGDFNLQARTAPFQDSTDATVFVAIAAAFGESDVIHVQISERRVIDAYVRLHEETEFRRVDFEQAERWSFTGLSVTGRNISGNGLFVVFDRGVGLQVKASEGALSILLTAPESFRGQTQGLMGTWNGNASDDFLTPQGMTLSPNLTTHELHYQFGLQWEIQAENSVFFYEMGTDHETNTNRSYTPIFEPVLNPALDQALVLEVCGTNQFCVFDFQTTGSQSFAQASVESFEQYEIAVQNTEIVSCPSLPPPLNGGVVVSRYSEGGVANFICDAGYTGHEVTLTCQSDGTWSDGEIPECQSASPTTELPLPIYAICLIAIGGVAVIIVLIALVFRICRRTKSQQDGADRKDAGHEAAHQNPTYVHN